MQNDLKTFERSTEKEEKRKNKRQIKFSQEENLHRK